jgi:hypothetical protein
MEWLYVEEPEVVLLASKEWPFAAAVGVVPRALQG